MVSERIVFAASQTGARANGGIRSLSNWIRRLDGFLPSVITNLEGTQFTSDLRAAGVPVRVLHWDHRSRGGRLAHEFLRCSRALRRPPLPDPSLLHLNDIQSLQRFGLAALARKLPFVFNVRGTKPEGNRYGPWWQFGARAARRWLVLSNEMKALLVRRVRGLSPNRVSVVPSVVDPQRIHPGTRAQARRVLGLPRDRLIVLYPAHFNDLKGQDRLVGCGFREIAASTPELLLCFVGDGDPVTNQTAARAHEWVRDIGLQNAVRFAGFRSDMGDWYRAADVVIVASRHEGLSRAMIEAVSSNRPVASFDVCSAREVLASGAGAVVPQGDHCQLLDAAVALARRPPSESLLRQAAAPFCPERVQERLHEFYRLTLGSST